MRYPYPRKFLRHALQAMLLACVFVLGVNSLDSHANPQLNAVSAVNPIVFQPRNIMPSSSSKKYHDTALSRHLLDIESQSDHSHALSGTEFIQLPIIQSPENSGFHLARRIVFQPASASASPVADLYFDFKRVRLGNDLIDVLHTSVDFQSAQEKGHIFLEVYCDQRGGLAYSLALADHRMELVRKYFLDLGVSPHNVQVMNYGPLRPACKGSMVQCQMSNLKIQSTFKFFAILEPQFGCLTRIKVAHSSRVAKGSNLAESPVVHRQIRLAPLN